MANTDSQYRIEQVVADSKPLGSASDTGADTTTVTTTTTDNTPVDTTTDAGKDTNPTDTPTTGEKPTIIIMNSDNPLFQSKENEKGMLNPSVVMYYSVMGAIFIALLATAYNAVKTAK